MTFTTLPKSIESKVLKAIKIAVDQVLDMRSKEGKSIEQERKKLRCCQERFEKSIRGYSKKLGRR